MTSHLIDTPESKKRIADLIMRLPDGEKFEVEVTAYKPNRTVLQNKLYWHWLNHLQNETGYDKDELHELGKRAVLGVQTKTVMGALIAITPSTTDLNVKEFIDYLEKFEAYFASKGFLLPAPSYYNDAMRK